MSSICFSNFIEICKVEVNNMVFTRADVIQGLKSDDDDDVVTKTLAAKAGYIYFMQKTAFATALVENGIIRPLMKALGRNDCTDLRFEATRCLAAICINYPVDVFKQGGVSKLVPLLDCGPALGAQAAQALGCIAAHSTQLRDEVLSEGGLKAMLPHMRPETPPELLRATVEAFRLICKQHNRSRMELQRVHRALPHLSELLITSNTDILESACLALASLGAGSKADKQALHCVPGLTVRLVPLMLHTHNVVALCALTAIHNILVNPDPQIDRIISQSIDEAISILPSCYYNKIQNKLFKPNYSRLLHRAQSELLMHECYVGARAHARALNEHECINTLFSKQAAKEIISKITDPFKGNPRELEKMILTTLLHKVLLHTDTRVQLQGVQAIINLSRRDTTEKVSVLSPGRLSRYCNVIGFDDIGVITKVLDAMKNMFEEAAIEGQEEELCIKLEEMGYVDEMELLQHHINLEVYYKNKYLIETYFDIEEMYDL